MITEKEYLKEDVVDQDQEYRRELILSADLVSDLESQALQGFPFEINGFLFGYRGEEELVDEILQVPNRAEDQHRRFRIDEKDYLKAELYALKSNKDLIGIYHSHPDYPAIPSETDLEFAQEEFSYLILSVDQHRLENLRSWVIRDKKFIHQNISVLTNEK